MPHTEKVISIPSEYTLSGTLRIPHNTQQPSPAVLLITGSGKVDRDSNLKNLKININRLLAEHLTQLGFVTLCYDKRGIGKSKGDYYRTGLFDFITDATNALRHLKQQPEVDANNVIILGHSEGAFIAPAVHAQQKANGLILLCGGATPGIELMPQQSSTMAREIQALKGIKGMLLRLVNVEKQFNKTLNKVLSSDKAVIRIFGKKVNAKWLREAYQYDVCAYLCQVDCPTLFITGGKDIQLPPEEAEKAPVFIQGPCQNEILPNMNHLLRDYPGTHHMLSLRKEYRQSIKQGLSPQLMQSIQAWLTSFLAKSSLTQPTQTGKMACLETNC